MIVINNNIDLRQSPRHLVVVLVEPPGPQSMCRRHLVLRTVPSQARWVSQLSRHFIIPSSHFLILHILVENREKGQNCQRSGGYRFRADSDEVSASLSRREVRGVNYL